MASEPLVRRKTESLEITDMVSLKRAVVHGNLRRH